jgi:putative component of membrane protein insertase Oxa1/YidC/SpoIIIJ protein YidD
MIRNSFPIIFFLLLTSVISAQDKIKGPFSIKESNPQKLIEESWIKTVYSNYISPADGNRCPMYPSCSSFAEQSITKHGPLIGFIMICDRLTKCGNDLFLYQSVMIKGQQRFYDPVK